MVDPEQERLKLEKVKAIYRKLPQGKQATLESPVDMAQLIEYNLLEKNVRPFVANKIKQLLGVEEQAMIKLVLDHLKHGQPATP